MKTLTFIALLTLAALAGCAPRSRPGPTMTNSTAATNASDELPAAASPVRVSAEGLNAAEPAVAASRDGAVYVAWAARAGGGGQTTTLYVSASRDGGRSFDAPVKVNDDLKPGVHGMHSLAVGEDGRIYVAWLDERDIAAAPDGEHMQMQMHGEHNREVFFSYSADGGRTFSANRRIAVEALPCLQTF